MKENFILPIKFGKDIRMDRVGSFDNFQHETMKLQTHAPNNFNAFCLPILLSMGKAHTRKTRLVERD